MAVGGKTVVILGGALGGLAVTHRLLKYTLPHQPDLKVILVSKNSHFYWNLASVRAVIPGIVKDEQLLQPIEPGLAQYPAGSVEFVLGTATDLDQHSQTVSVSLSASESSAPNPRLISYDYLVLATGANPQDESMPWKAAGSYEECIASLHRTASQIHSANHIIVSGAGPTGVELAAEIRYEFPKKEVILLCADEALVGGDSTAATIEKELVRLGVTIRKGARAVRIEEGPVEVDGGNTQVTLSSGESIGTDLYLPTTGLVPNTGFLPAEFLTDAKYVDVDEYYQVKARQNIWAVGDMVSKPRAGFLHTEAQAAGVAKNIDLVLSGKEQQTVSGPLIDVFIFSMGRGRGAGRLGPIHVPSLSVWAVKSRTLGMERTAKYVNGTMW